MRRTMKPVILTGWILWVMLQLSTLIFAQSQSWQPAGFGGAGYFTGIYVDPVQPNILYATSDVSGVHRSSDYGEHWELRSLGLGNYEIACLAFDPLDHNTLYVGTGAPADSNCHAQPQPTNRLHECLRCVYADWVTLPGASS